MAEEGRLAPELAAANLPEGSGKDSRKRGGKQVLAAEPGAPQRPTKKAALAGASGSKPATATCCPIHANATHDAQDRRTLQTIKEKREQRHEERRAARACFNCGDIGHLSRDCPNNPRNEAGRGGANSGDKGEPARGRSQGRGGKDRPRRGRDKSRAADQREDDCSDDVDEPGFQEPRDVAYPRGSIRSHVSRRREAAHP